MTTWSRYYLKDIPFLAIPAIKIGSYDKRANGQLYYSKFSEEEIAEMTKMIELEAFPWVFLNTKGEALGNGKSAFMAHIYWNLKKKGRNVIWAFARDDPRLTHLLSVVLDSFVSEGKLVSLKASLQPITTDTIKLQLGKALYRYGSRTINALNRILNEEDEKLVYTFTIIKKSIPTQDHGELFGALLHLAYATGQTRFTIFIDQFEEYVKAHTSDRQIARLGNEINDLQREIGETTTFVVSTHPEVIEKIISSTPEAETFTRVDMSSVRLPEMTRNDLLEMIAVYLRDFRVDDYKGDIYHPFKKEVIMYAAERTGLNPRNLILALRHALLYGALANFSIIDETFLMENHSKMFGGLENKWKEFKKGTWKHAIT